MIKQTNVAIPGTKNGKGNPIDDIRAFLKSGSENCEIDTSPYSSAQTCRASYLSTASRAGLTKNISVISRKERVFLVRIGE